MALLSWFAARRILHRGHSSTRTHSINTDSLPVGAVALMQQADRFSGLLNWAAAGPLYALAEEKFRQSGDTRNELYARTGRLRGQFDQLSFVAISSSLEQILNDPITQNDLHLRLWCLVNKGYTDLEINLPAARAEWTSARNIALQLGEDRWAVRALGELGVVAFLEGNMSVAAARVGQALFSTMAHGDIGGEMRLSNMIGTGLNEIHRYSEALPFFDRVIKLAGQHQDAGFPFMAYERKAEALLELGRHQEGREILKRVIEESTVENRPGAQMQALVLIGKLSAREGDRWAALRDLQTAARIAGKLKFYRMAACAMYDMAPIYDSLGELTKAEESMIMAIDASRRVGDRFFLPRDLTALATLKVRAGETRSANLLFEEAEDVLDGMLSNMHVSFWKCGLGAAARETYIRHFRLLVATHNVGKALQVVERVRARTTAALLQARRPEANRRTADTADIEDQIAGLQTSLMQEHPKNEREELLERLLNYERRLIFLQNNSALNHREFLGKPVSLPAVQEVLGQDDLLLEYVLDDPQSFCIAVSKGSAEIIVLNAGRTEVEARIQQYLSAVRDKKRESEIAQQLYSMLVAPTRAKQKQRLIVAADGALRRIPFEALRNPDGRYLIQSHTITYIPSATVLQAIRNSRGSHRPSPPLLAIGNVPYEDQALFDANQNPVKAAVLRGLYDLVGVRLKSLPQSREEVIAIGRKIGGDAVLLLGRSATESNFKAQPLSDFKIIHIAAHAVADTDIPERAALVLARDPNSADDGLLQVREIVELKLNAELVVLSACDTGAGGMQSEAGITSLEEAFLVAGAKSVVASLWEVDDTYTAALMDRFYEHLVAGQDKAGSLRQAKLDMLEKYGIDTPPYYWASFVIAGDGASPISWRDHLLHK
ncbi:MAG TPA: CHAT domain-containing protein [Candidatus Angelobacter sp.]|nr:CHAT domain-containing protein [Candidatus Angelobacter sp.]